MKVSKRSIGLILVSVLVFLLPSSVSASYPGRNGVIATLSLDSDPYSGPTEYITRIFPDGSFPVNFGVGPDNPEISNENDFGGVEYSPTGRHIAFDLNVWDGRASDIWIARSDDTEWRRLTRYVGWDRSPTWAPGGRRLAFVRTTTEGSFLQIIGVGGKNLRRVYGAGPRVSSPRWSPLGDRIAFITDWDPEDSSVYDFAIWTIQPDGTGLQRVSGSGSPGSFDWAPDGSHLVYTRNASEIVRVDPDGSNEEVLIDPGWSPVYSPDGKWIVYSAWVSGKERLLRVQSDGTNARVVRIRTGEDVTIGGATSWQPRRPFRASRITVEERDRDPTTISLRGSVVPLSRFEKVVLLVRLASSGELLNRKEALTNTNGGFWMRIPKDGNRPCVLTLRFIGDATLLSDSTRLRTHC
jgi:dipeptidyl aminopeptidase/acylaminoacyl peptidase